MKVMGRMEGRGAGTERTSSQYLPVGTLVMPGKSTRVRFSTCGENILRFIDTLDIPLLLPTGTEHETEQGG